MTNETGRKKIVHNIVKYIRDRAPREVYNDHIADALDLTREQVRNAMRNWLHAHPNEGVAETSPYWYAAQVQQPVVETLAAHGRVSEQGCDFVVVLRREERIFLEEQSDKSLWVAKKI